MGSVFGGKKSKSSQYNQAYDYINQTFSPLTSYAGTGAEALAALLGGDASGFNAYKKATGFDAAAEQGSRGVTGNAAASGLLRSGSTAKALQTYGTNLQNQYADNYLNRLLGLTNIGLQSGSLISGAGNVGTSSSKDKPGLGGLVGTALSGGASG